jgi:hypothetical protein
MISFKQILISYREIEGFEILILHGRPQIPLNAAERTVKDMNLSLLKLAIFFTSGNNE